MSSKLVDQDLWAEQFLFRFPSVEMVRLINKFVCGDEHQYYANLTPHEVKDEFQRLNDPFGTSYRL